MLQIYPPGEGLAKQLTSPILWQKCMEPRRVNTQPAFYIESPGRVLTGLMRRIHRKTRVVNVSSLQAIEKLLEQAAV